jgi:hypothetical protein
MFEIKNINYKLAEKYFVKIWTLKTAEEDIFVSDFEFISLKHLGRNVSYIWNVCTKYLSL